MRRSLLIAVILAAAAGLIAFLAFRPTGTGDSRPVVAITQIATHPALDEVKQGIVRGLAERGFVDGRNITILFRNANGDASLTAPIAQDFVRRNVSVIVPISTPSTLAVAAETRSIPVVFSGVTDPVGVGLIRDLNSPGGNITGVSDRWPFELQVRTFLRHFPRVRTIGMLYTRGDDVSRIGVEALQNLSRSMGFRLVLRPVSSPQDIYPSAVQLFGEVDAIYTGIDHLLLENMDGLTQASRETRKPLFGGESGSVEKGAVLAVTINMTQFGNITAELVAQVLHGTAPGRIPVRTVSNGELLVNAAAARRFGLDVERLRAEGAHIIDGPQ